MGEWSGAGGQLRGAGKQIWGVWGSDLPRARSHPHPSSSQQQGQASTYNNEVFSTDTF